MSIIVLVILGFIGLAAIVRVAERVSMTPEQHRQQAHYESLQATGSRRAKWVSAHNQRAEAHLRLAEEQERWQ